MREINKVAVVGAGIMGHGIAQNFARHGYDTSLYDVDEDILQRAHESIRSNLETFVQAGMEKSDRVDPILARITLTTSLREAVDGADYITEAAPEDFDLKAKIYREMDGYVHGEAILASNTSMLSISGFGGDVEKKGNLIVAHWFNPPHIVPVVELVMGAHTTEDTYRRTHRLLASIGKTPVKVRKEIPGFLVNRIQTAMFREVLSLLEQGVASPEDLDSAVKGSFGLRLGVIGVLETMDLAGLDLMYKGTKYLYPFIDRSLEPQKALVEKVENGQLGAKTGRGFFDYDTEAGSAGGDSKIKSRDKKLLEMLRLLYPSRK